MARRPRILYVVYNVPHVPAPGGLTRAFHLVRAAAGVGEVTLAGAVEPDVAIHPEAIAPYCRALHLAPAPPLPSPPAPLRPVARLARAAQALLDDHAPEVLWRFDPRPLRALVAGLLSATAMPFDLVLTEHVELAAALLPVLRAHPVPAALADLHNVLSVHQERTARMERPGPRGALRRGDRIAIARIRTQERRLLRGYTQITAVSGADAARLRQIVPSARVAVVPNGVDAGYFGAVAACEPDALPRVVFTGALWYRPNSDGLRWFANAVWPRILACRSDARFSIVGARPGPEVCALAAQPGIEVHPSVEDVRPYLAEAAVAVVPLRLGSGTRLKVLEALAAGRPVVATSLGAEGLRLAPGRDLLLAERPEEFAAAVLALLDRPALARRMAAAGRETVRRRYTWQSIGAGFQSVLVELLDSAARASTAQPLSDRRAS